MVKLPVTLSSWPARSLFCLALAGLGWAMGYGMGRNSNIPPDDSMGKKALPSAGVPGAGNGLSLLGQRQHLLREPGGLARRLALLRLADQTSTGGRLSLLNDGSLSMDEATRVVQAWAEEDPAACWAWQREGGMPGVDFTNTIFGAWAKKAPEAAVAAARSAPLARRGSAAAALFSVWMRNESPAAGALAPHLDQLAALRGGNLGPQWGIADEDGKMSSRILSLPPGPARAGLLRGYASGLFDKDWEQGAAWAAKLPDSDRAAAMEELAGAALMNGRIASYSGADRKEPGPERQAWARQWLEEEADPATRARLGLATSPASPPPIPPEPWPGQRKT